MELKNIPDPGFAGDDGSPEPRLAAALAAWSETPCEATETDLLALLADARLLVPIIAVLGETEIGPDGRKGEKTSDMAVATLRLPDGRHGLPAFTSLDTLRRWRPDARPAPVPACKAVDAAWHSGAETLLIDVSGPVFYELSGAALRAVAERRPHLPPARDPEIADALRALLAHHPVVRRAHLLPAADEDTDARLVVVPAASETDDQLPAAAHQLAEAVRDLAADLAADPLLRVRLDRGLDLAVVPDDRTAPGPPLYRRH